MAFLRKKKRSPNWFAVFKDGPRNIEKSMKTTNKHEAQRRMGRWAFQLERSPIKKLGKITFSDLAQSWLEMQDTPDKKKRTMVSYRERLKPLLPFFKDVYVNRITAEMVERFKVELSKSVGPRSVNYSLWCLRSILNQAVRFGYASTNVAKLVPGLKQVKTEKPVLSVAQLNRLFEAAPSLQTKAMFMFAALCGPRIGEILALTWDSVNLDKKTAVIRASFSDYGLETTPKTGESRTIDLPESVVNILRELRKQQLQTPPHENHNLVFPNENGGYLDPANFRHYVFYKTLKAAGLPPVRFHDLRRAATSLLLESGASLKYVMSQLGHKTPTMTLSVYAGVSEEARKNAQDRLEKYVFNNRENLA